MATQGEKIVDRALTKTGGVALGAGIGGLVAAPLILAAGAAAAPFTLGLSLPITLAAVGIGGWLGHKATQNSEPTKYVK